MSLHERVAVEEGAQVGSERNFGLTFAVIAALIALFSWYQGSASWPFWLAGSVLFGVLAVTLPAWLRVPNRLWFRFGMVLHKIISPVVMIMLFFGAFLPVGLLMRAAGRRPLESVADKNAMTYWTSRTERPASMQKQY